MITSAALSALSDAAISGQRAGTNDFVLLRERWLADFHGLASVHAQRGWDALVAPGWSIQQPRPRHPQAATAEDRAAFKKSSSVPRPKSVIAAVAADGRSPLDLEMLRDGHLSFPQEAHVALARRPR